MKLLAWLKGVARETGGREILTVAGLLLLSAGVWSISSAAIACIVLGALLLYLGLWHSALFAKVTSKVE